MGKWQRKRGRKEQRPQSPFIRHPFIRFPQSSAGLFPYSLDTWRGFDRGQGLFHMQNAAFQRQVDGFGAIRHF